jgi:hypothetical protein
MFGQKSVRSVEYATNALICVLRPTHFQNKSFPKNHPQCGLETNLWAINPRCTPKLMDIVRNVTHSTIYQTINVKYMNELKKLEDKELKVIAYDCLVEIERLQNIIKNISQELQGRGNVQPVKTENSPKAESVPK